MDSSNLRNQLDQAKEESKQNEEAAEQPDTDDPEPPVDNTATGDESAQTDDDASDEKRDSSNETTSNTQEKQGGPAFTPQESDKISIYPHTDNSRFIKVLCNGVENDLLALGHDDFAVREAHDAMVRLAHEYPREVTQLVLEARGINPDAADDLP